MDSYEASIKAAILDGQVKTLEGIFEILDIKITEQFGKMYRKDWNTLVDRLEAFEAQIEKVKEKRDFYLSFAG